MVGFNKTCYLSPGLFHRIEKQSGHGRTLEHQESSGSEVIMNGIVVCKLCIGTEKQTNKDPR